MNRSRAAVITVVVTVFLIVLSGCKAYITVTVPDSSTVPTAPTTESEVPTTAPTTAPSTESESESPSSEESESAEPSESAEAEGDDDGDSSENSEGQLIIKHSGTWEGNGRKVSNIRIEADTVVVRGFVVSGGKGTGIWAKGNNITIDGNDISKIKLGEDLDGIRFFGDNIKITNNVIHDLAPKYDMEGAHIDCMQTWSSESTGPTSYLVISGNKCLSNNKEIHQCIMAEGDDSEEGGGGSSEGDSTNWLIENNELNNFAGQCIALRDIQKVVVRNNNFTGAGKRAITVADGSTVDVEGNTLGPGFKSLQGK